MQNLYFWIPIKLHDCLIKELPKRTNVATSRGILIPHWHKIPQGPEAAMSYQWILISHSNRTSQQQCRASKIFQTEIWKCFDGIFASMLLTMLFIRLECGILGQCLQLSYSITYWMSNIGLMLQNKLHNHALNTCSQIYSNTYKP